MLHLAYRTLQLEVHFVDPRCWNIPIILPEDDPLRVEAS